MKDLSLHILDIAQNCYTAGASKVCIGLEIKGGTCTLMVSDNGKGMDGETLKMATNPFFTTRTTRKVGLGIPFLKQNAELTGGSLAITSKPGEGTAIKAIFNTTSIDMLPYGNLANTFMLLITGYQQVDTIVDVSWANGRYAISTFELKNTLNEALDNPGLPRLIEEMIEENIAASHRQQEPGQNA
ncbi:MAG: sensor histidine kinase [Bacteroidales bacterium]|nr:sensor histidine kinase [Bacteroidales bacterium]